MCCAGVGLTPAMGWSSWNTFRCDVNESLVLGIADALGRKMYSWLATVDGLEEGKRPPKPPGFDSRELSASLAERRQATYDAAMEHWTELHVQWLIANDARKKKLRAEYDRLVSGLAASGAVPQNVVAQAASRGSGGEDLLERVQRTTHGAAKRVHKGGLHDVVALSQFKLLH